MVLHVLALASTCDSNSHGPISGDLETGCSNSCTPHQTHLSYGLLDALISMFLMAHVFVALIMAQWTSPGIEKYSLTCDEKMCVIKID